jgi:hypothetical protein
MEEVIKPAHAHCVQVMLGNVSPLFDAMNVVLEIKPIFIEKTVLIVSISIIPILLLS